MRHDRTTCMALIVMATVALAACDTESELTVPGLDPGEVENGARYAGTIRASTEAAELMTLEIAAHTVEVTSSPAPFDLGDGISGTVSMTEGDGYYFSFSGTTDVGGATVPVLVGRLRLTPAADHPVNGSEYEFYYLARVQSARWEEVWHLTGSATVDATGSAITYEMTRTFDPDDAPQPLILVRPSHMDVIMIGARGRELHFAFDRTTLTGMEGTVTLNGLMVATVTIAAGCAHVDYGDESLEDADVCFAH